MLSKYFKRSTQPELIDLGPSHYTPSEYRHCLYQLARIGCLLGGDRATFWAMRQLRKKPHSILDVGCGGGIFTLKLAEIDLSMRVVGIDISPEAITFAQQHKKEHYSHLTNTQFILSKTPDIHSYGSFDVVMATLVCHHLPDQELVAFIQQACMTAEKAVILNDLHRHLFATFGFAIVAPLLFRNRLIWHDGLLSIKRSFQYREWKKILEAAGIEATYYTISWHWAFRWIIFIDVERMRKNQRERTHAGS